MIEIKVGEGEYKKCQRCKKRFRRKKSIWNMFGDAYGYLFCSKCQDSFNKWWERKEAKG